VEASSRTVYSWNCADDASRREIAEKTAFTLTPAESTGDPHDGETREIRGCIPGEAVFVNGIVIGTATDKTVVLSTRGGASGQSPGLTRNLMGLRNSSGPGFLTSKQPGARAG